MPDTLAILRARRERRLARKQKQSSRARNAIVSAGMVFSIILGALILLAAIAYADLTRDLPSIEILPRLLNPPDGLALQPTRIYDRTGQHLLYTFAPNESPRRYIPLSDTNPQHLPKPFADAVIIMTDPNFWNHAGYSMEGIDNPDFHPTIAQKLVADLLLYDEPPSLKRALRERLLAAQITAHYGRMQILEWYLNSTSYGRYAFGAEAASQLYFAKSVTQLNLVEATILAAVSETPSLNPLDAPEAAAQRGREVLHVMGNMGLVADVDVQHALTQPPAFEPPYPSTPPIDASFVNLVIAQLQSRFSRPRIERGGLSIITTLDYDLYQQASCITEAYASRLAGLADPQTECDAARDLPSLPPGITIADSSASALILDSKNGQVLAIVGETRGGKETPLVAAHNAGSSMDAFIYLTGFTRGLSPASLTWDVPEQVDVLNYDGEYHGPVRLRVALANDYRVPAQQIMEQMGLENVVKVVKSFGLEWDQPVTMLKLAGAYGALGQDGVYYGQTLNDDFAPTSILRVESADHEIWLDWSAPQARPIVTPALAYLMANALSDESVRALKTFNMDRAVGAKIGQTEDGNDTWAIGFIPSRVVVTWTGSRATGNPSDPRLPAILWKALMQYASRDLPMEGWSAPAGIATMNICDPSGMLPTADCPNVVSEVFLNGNEPTQADNLYRRYAVNHETGFLATVFTPAQLVDERVFMVVPADMRGWAQSAGLPIPPDSYDAIQPPIKNPDVNIETPEMFSQINGATRITGTAAGKDFVSYTIVAGKGINPQTWIKVTESQTSVQGGVLAEWDTTGLSGLYAIQLQVLRADQRMDTAIIQVTIGQ